MRWRLKQAVAHRRMQTLANLLNSRSYNFPNMTVEDIQRWIMITGGASYREVFDALCSKRMIKLIHLYLIGEEREVSISEELMIWLWTQSLMRVSREAYDQAVKACVEHLWDVWLNDTRREEKDDIIKRGTDVTSSL